MTASTEQGRADFESAFIEQKLMERGISGDVAEKDLREVFLWKDAAGCYDHKETKAALWGWQAARRAQVVPQGWKLAIGLCELVECENAGDSDFERGMRTAAKRIRKELGAAAPQPPEAEIQPTVCKTEIQTIGCNEAAPVQLPEPVAEITFHSRKKPDVEWLVNSVVRGTKLYTEQQVRQLLASTNKPE